MSSTPVQQGRHIDEESGENNVLWRTPENCVECLDVLEKVRPRTVEQFLSPSVLMTALLCSATEETLWLKGWDSKDVTESLNLWPHLGDGGSYTESQMTRTI